MPSDIPLWRQSDFRRLWAAQAISEFGGRISREGLPMMAVVALAATPSQLGVLAALSGAAALLVGLTAGGFVDRSARRAILVAADLFRAVVLLSVPLAAWRGWLSMPQVYAAAALVAAASTLFSIADHAYLPGLVGRDQLTAANARISATESVAEMGGPALAGLLFQWLTAPFAVALNAATYVASAAFLARIRHVEMPAPPQPAAKRSFEGLRTGFATAWAEPIARPMLAMAAISGLFGGVFSALYVVFTLRTLHLTPALLGLAIACGGAGALLGALLAQPLVRRLGLGQAIVVSGMASAGSAMLVPLAPSGATGGLTTLVVSQVLGDAFGVANLVLSVSLYQSVISARLLGRVGAAFRTASGGAAAAGALGGGLLGEAIGARGALAVAAAGLALAPTLAMLSPIRGLREIPPAGAELSETHGVA